LPECWCLHPDLVEELLWLMHAAREWPATGTGRSLDPPPACALLQAASVTASGWDLTRAPRSACGAPPQMSGVPASNSCAIRLSPTRHAPLTSAFRLSVVIGRLVTCRAIRGVERFVE
jgi:hypothetical protein